MNKPLTVVSENEKKRLALEFEAVGEGFMENEKFSDAVRIYKRAISLNDE